MRHAGLATAIGVIERTGHGPTAWAREAMRIALGDGPVVTAAATVGFARAG